MTISFHNIAEYCIVCFLFQINTGCFIYFLTFLTVVNYNCRGMKNNQKLLLFLFGGIVSKH